jgi:NADH dehydrogenase
MSNRPRVVIVGAGFGGLSTARGLAGSPVDVTVMDHNNYHTFHALLYQVAAAELEPEQISYPVRTILRRMSNARFLMQHVERVDLDSKLVITADGPISYDFLVLATGSKSRFFSVPGAAEHSFELKTLDHAIELRNHILCCLEHATVASSAEMRMPLLRFVIVGGGPTGVEFAGALAELLRGPLVRDFPMLHLTGNNISLVEAGNSLLAGLPLRCGLYAHKRLREMGVELFLNTAVMEVTRKGVSLDNGTTLETETVIWTAGVQGDDLAKASGLPTGQDGRVPVLPTLQASDHDEVYVIGDLAYVKSDGRPLPFVAPVAIQQGAATAVNIKRQLEKADPLPFNYRDKGSLATIGRFAAVASIGHSEFKGPLAWALWLTIHIFNLIGFRNRLLVTVNWAWDFLFWDRAVRLILPSEACTRAARLSNDKGD